MSGQVSVFRLSSREAKEQIDALSTVLIDCVEGGASVSFMHPLAPEVASDFWARSLAAADAGGRVVLGAFDQDGQLVATVTLHLDCPPNQPHRGEIAKLLVRRSARRRGLARALLERAEAEAKAAGKTLLVLDTVVGGEAEALYRTAGWVEVGVVPDYALWPDGRPVDTTVFWKRVG